MRNVLLILFVLAISVPARADDRWQVHTSIHLAYLIAGGPAVRGGAAPATGGIAFVPTLGLAYAHRIVDPYVAISPIIVTPHSVDALGVVGAVDLGGAWHLDRRAWALGTGATLAPAYMRFCNSVWCLREGVWLVGGEMHLDGVLLDGENGSGLSVSLSGRLLTGRPTAWYWSRLSPEEAAVNHFSGLANVGILWRF